jgi:molybdenum cofactor biosynthesis protein B
MKLSESSEQHKATAPRCLTFALIVVSSSRFQLLLKGERVTDPSGTLMTRLLTEAGHAVDSKRIIADEQGLLERSLRTAIDRSSVDAVILSGGTGISPTDITVETVRPLLGKELPGFGELLRRISFDDIGSSALLTRAVAGLYNGKPVFCIPGSPQAVETALARLIIPETGHIVKHARDA